MTTKVLEPAGAAPVVPQVPASTYVRVDRTARTVVYWSLIGFGALIPFVGGFVGMIRAL